MNVSRTTRRATEATTSVVTAGCVWESRMKVDQVKGGIKVFNDECIDKKQSSKGISSSKRKTWKSDDKTPIQIAAGRSDDLDEQCKDIRVSIDGDKKSLIQLKNGTSVNGDEKTPNQIRKPRSDLINGRNYDQLRNKRSAISKNLADKVVIRSVQRSNGSCINGIDENLIEIEKHVSAKQSILSNACNLSVDDTHGDDETVVEKSIDGIKKIDVKQNGTHELVGKQVKQIHQFNNRREAIASSTSVIKQKPPQIRRKEDKSKSPSNGYQNFPQTHVKLQSLVDLIMWRDVSRSTFVFGNGTFIIISSSCTKNLNISFISVISYLGLVYLAAVFLYRSVICRGVIDMEDTTSYAVGEEEALWLMKLILPYINEFLLKSKFLFSGDAATTMKLAVILFALARCGNSITLWKMAKFGFWGVLVVPKLCSSYSAQLTTYAKYWKSRVLIAWESCSQKKVVAFSMFTLVWNLSSIVTRIWAVFLLFVAVRYRHQTNFRENRIAADEVDAIK